MMLPIIHAPHKRLLGILSFATSNTIKKNEFSFKYLYLKYWYSGYCHGNIFKKERKLNYLGKSWEIPWKPWRKVRTDIIIKSEKWVAVHRAPQVFGILNCLKSIKTQI